MRRARQFLFWVVALCIAVDVLAQERFAVRGFTFEGESPLSQAAMQAIVAPYMGESVSVEQLQGAATALETALAARGFAFYRVVLPPQPAEGTIRLQVLPFKLAKVVVSGNQNFSTENVLRGFPELRAGASPNLFAVARNRAQVNELPAKSANVTFRQSAQPDSVDAEVAVQDSPPQRVFASLANTGTPQTGPWRASLGYQHSDLFDRDHALTASYTTSPGHWSDVSQYGLFYSVPFYALGGQLSAFYSHSDVNSGTIANLFQVSGRGNFAGLRWKQHLLPINAYSHSFDVAVEDRFFENNVAFGGVPIGVNVRSRPLSLSYSGRYDYASGQLGGSLERAQNLPGGQDNTDAAYAGNRAGADRRWYAWRWSFEAQQAIGAWIAGARLRGQYAKQPLVAGEQFGFGGASSVRGLAEREATGDMGLQANLEMLSPVFAETFRGLAFFDAGQVRLRNVAATQSSLIGASSIGAGLRWTPRRGVAVSLDLAHVLNGATTTMAGHNRLLAAIALQF